MVNWSSSMQQDFEYYVVDPGTWKNAKKIENVISCTINRDSSAETLGSANISVNESLGECYIRIYLVTIQNGVKERHPLGVFLVQTPSSKFDGKVQSISIDAYTPLLELKESPPSIGYYVGKTENIMNAAYEIVRDNVRAPVVQTTCKTRLRSDFVANTDDTWLTFTSDLIANAEYSFALDEMGRILFSPYRDTASLQPVWTYTDDNSSILYPELDTDHDLYGIPNVVEVVYSNGDEHYYSRVVNDNSSSPISTVNREREIIHRVSNPDLNGELSQVRIDEYAKSLLRELSCLEYTITYTHGYCPVRLGDCIRLNYARAGLTNTKAKVISQTIKCVPGCPVTEKAVFTSKLWG